MALSTQTPPRRVSASDALEVSKVAAPKPKTALMTVVGKNGPPSLAQAAAQLHVAEADLIADFGVVPIEAGRYTVEVLADKVPTKSNESTPYSGPYSNPRIEPFGPVKS